MTVQGKGVEWSSRPALRELRTYDVDPSPCEIELADNTSQFGVPPAALAVIVANAGNLLARYPTTYSRELRAAIADYVGVAEDEVMVGCGSDEVMQCAFRALGEPGERVAYMDPTFVMTRVFAASNSLAPVGVPLALDLDVDANAMVQAGAPITYVCTPNNPTGVAIDRSRLDQVLRDAAGLVFVDEAYAEYAGTNIAREAPAHGRMLVFRTFSKALGLAGMRVGFAVGARPLIADLEKVRGPYTVTALSERAALAAVREDRAWVVGCVAEVVETREAFVQGLRRVGLTPLPSAANFVLIPVKSAVETMRALRSRGILVRHFNALPRIGDAIRVTVPARQVLDRVLQAVGEVAGGAA